jgi:hypothetical protein
MVFKRLALRNGEVSEISLEDGFLYTLYTKQQIAGTTRESRGHNAWVRDSSLLLLENPPNLESGKRIFNGFFENMLFLFYIN